MKIRLLATGAVLAAALAIPAIPASADEAPAPTPASADDLGWGSPGSGATPSPSPTARPSGDLGWG
ncbi:hypothetical protein ABZ874_24120 [Streptomyces albidoflavus]|uniref:hypothetical protein n=1 Tax=Streptomyces albidoflavus TaxID=1886 RepID=UPI0033EEFDF2